MSASRCWRTEIQSKRKQSRARIVLLLRAAVVQQYRCQTLNSAASGSEPTCARDAKEVTAFYLHRGNRRRVDRQRKKSTRARAAGEASSACNSTRDRTTGSRTSRRARSVGWRESSTRRRSFRLSGSSSCESERVRDSKHKSPQRDRICRVNREARTPSSAGCV